VIRRIVLLVTSPRVPAGLLTAAAWDLVRQVPVFAGAESELTHALRSHQVTVTITDAPAQALLTSTDQTVVWLSGPDGDEAMARELGLKLAREPGLAELELMYGSWDPPGARLLDAVHVVDRLRAEDPWKREQTHRTLAKYLLEEAYEAHDAILSEDHDELRAEMGDVLFQVLLHARLAEELPEDERWSIDDLAGDFVAKMIRRNPNVFGDVKAETVDEVVEQWEQIKQEEKPSTITWSLPSLILARKILHRAQRHGVPAPESDGTLGGDLLALLARSDEDAEAALRTALRRLAENL
jgi:XTP/dITP diphosphohydrolase